MSNIQALVSTLIQLGEWVIIVGVVYLLFRLGWVTTEQAQVVAGLILGGLAFFIRKADAVPVPDYVDQTTTQK